MSKTCGCGSTDNVKKTIVGLRCKSCRELDMQCMDTLRKVGAMPTVKGKPIRTKQDYYGKDSPKRCIEEDGKRATWVRRTQFSGDHYFCDRCAKRQKNFGKSDSAFYWEKVGKKPANPKHLPKPMAKRTPKK